MPWISASDLLPELEPELAVEVELELGLEPEADPVVVVELELEPQPATAPAAITASNGRIIRGIDSPSSAAVATCEPHRSDGVFAL